MVGTPPPQLSPALREREQIARFIESARHAGRRLSREAGEGEGGGHFEASRKKRC